MCNRLQHAKLGQCVCYILKQVDMESLERSDKDKRNQRRYQAILD